MGNRKEYLTKALVDVCQLIYTKGWVANHDGNVTVRFDDMLLATPTAVSKGDILQETVITLDMQGNKIQGIGKPFSEIKLHLAAYRAREEAQAVVHAHPPFAMAKGLVGTNFEVKIPEAIVSIGNIIPVAPYAFPGAKENDDIVTAALAQSDVFMMTGNGVLAIGRDVKEAFLRIELLEHLLKIDYYAKSMGTPITIPEADKQKLIEKRASLGLGPKKSSLPPLNLKNPGQSPQDQTGIIKDLIAQELKKILNK